MCSRSRKWGNSGPRRWTFPLVHHWMFYSIEWWAYSLTGAVSTGGGSHSPQSKGLCWGNEAARPWGRPHAGSKLRARALSLQSDDLQSGTSTVEQGGNRISQRSWEMTGWPVRFTLWCMERKLNYGLTWRSIPTFTVGFVKTPTCSVMVDYLHSL